MRFASLGSGSRGNALIVEAGNTRVLVDCGFGLRDLAGRLSRCGLSPDDIDAVLVTHEHGEHIGGVARLAAKHATKVFLTHGTLVASGFDPALARVFEECDRAGRMGGHTKSIQTFMAADKPETIRLVFSS